MTTATPCAHITALDQATPPRARVCEECVAIGSRWVHDEVVSEGFVTPPVTAGLTISKIFRAGGESLVAHYPIVGGRFVCLAEAGRDDPSRFRFHAEAGSPEGRREHEAYESD